MRSLISGIVGLLLGSMCLLSSLVRGGPRGEGAALAGELCGLGMGVLFFFGGIFYLIKGFMDVQSGPAKSRNKRRTRPIFEEDDDDRPRRSRRSRDDDDDDDEDDRPRRRRRSRDDDYDD